MSAQTVAEVIRASILASARKRLANVEALENAPDVLLDQAKRKLGIAERNVTKVAGLKEVGALVSIGTPDVRTGNGGRKYLAIHTSEGDVLFFPNAKFGRYAAKAK